MFTKDAISLCVYTVYKMCFKCLPLTHMHVLSRACQWMRQLCVVQCCAKRLSPYLKGIHNKQTKYYNDVTVKSAPGRKINKQIKVSK